MLPASPLFCIASETYVPEPSKNHDLHGNAPDASPVALLIVDMINDLDFPGNEYLIELAPALAENIASLKRACKQHRIPVIYANDNRGRWRSDFPRVLAEATRTESKGRNMVQRIAPHEDDYIVLKPKHSAFYATPLDVILTYLQVKTIIIAGITTNSCVMLTVSDAYVRDLKTLLVSECVAGQSEEDQRKAIERMEKDFAAKVVRMQDLDLEALRRAS